MGSMIKLWIFQGRGRDGHHSQLGSVAKKERIFATPVICIISCADPGIFDMGGGGPD